MDKKENTEKTEPPKEFDRLNFIVTGIMETDAPSLYAPTNGRDLFALWSDKVELSDSISPEDERLTLFANHAVRLFEKTELGRRIGPMRLGFAQSKSVPFLRSSVEFGTAQPSFLIRVAAQTKEEHEKVKNELLPVRGGRVPEHLWVEMQHTMVVTGIVAMLFVSTFDGSKIATIPVAHDPVFASNHVAECIVFWDHVRRGVPPKNAVIPPDVDPDSVDVDPDSVDEKQLPLTNEEEHA